MQRIDTLPDDTLAAALKRSAAFWDQTLSDANELSSFPLLTPERFAARLKKEQITSDRAYAPSSFSFNEPLALVPAYRRAVWRELQHVIDKTGARALVTFLPAILQLDVPVFTTLQSRKLPGISVASNNTPVATEAIRQLHADGVIATPESAALLEAALVQPDAPRIQYWYIVLPASASLYRSRLAIAYHDLHIMPGVSVASQCKALAQTGEDRFHPSSDYVWETAGDTLIVSSIDDRPTPLLRMPACRGSITREACACGAQFLLSRYV